MQQDNNNIFMYFTIHIHLRLISEIKYFATFYKKASYSFSSINQTEYGQPIYFSISIPNTNKNIEAATSFTNFVLSTNIGKRILESQGLNYLKKPIIEGDVLEIPSSIKTSSK